MVENSPLGVFWRNIERNISVSMDYRTTGFGTRRVVGKFLQTFMSFYMTEIKHREDCFSKQCEGKGKKIILAWFHYKKPILSIAGAIVKGCKQLAANRCSGNDSRERRKSGLLLLSCVFSAELQQYSFYQVLFYGWFITYDCYCCQFHIM